MCEGLKDLLYKPVEQDSRNMAKLGNALGWDYLEQEGKENVGNPGRAVGKAAAHAATWYLGSGLGEMGAGASQMAPAATEAAVTTAAEQAAAKTAEELAREAATQGFEQSLMPQGFGTTMEAGLMDTGYTPSSLWNAAKNMPGNMPKTIMGPQSEFQVGQGMGQTMQNYGQGMMGRMTSPGFKQNLSKNMMTRQGMGMMNQQPPQPPPPQPYQRPPEAQMQPMYGMNQHETGMGMQQPGMGMDEEELKRRLRAAGYPI